MFWLNKLEQKGLPDPIDGPSKNSMAGVVLYNPGHLTTVLLLDWFTSETDL